MAAAEKESAISHHSHCDLSGAAGRAGAIVRWCRLHPFGADLVELVLAVFVGIDLLDEDRRFLDIVEDIRVVLRSGNGHIEQPSFLGMVIRLWFRQYQVQQRLVLDFRREPVGIVIDVNHDHEVRLLALAPVHRVENELVGGVQPGHGLQKLWLGEGVSAEDEDDGRARVACLDLLHTVLNRLADILVILD